MFKETRDAIAKECLMDLIVQISFTDCWEPKGSNAKFHTTKLVSSGPTKSVTIPSPSVLFHVSAEKKRYHRTRKLTYSKSKGAAIINTGVLSYANSAA